MDTHCCFGEMRMRMERSYYHGGSLIGNCKTGFEEAGTGVDNCGFHGCEVEEPKP
jgi:hypothetical protein